MDWDDQGNGYRGQFSRQDRFGGWNAEGQDFYGEQGFRGQERFGEPYSGQYGQGGYGQDYGRQAADWQGGRYGAQRSSGQRGGWDQDQMGGRGYRDEGQFRGRGGPGAGYSMATSGGGESYGRGDFQRSGGWQTGAEQGWGSQGRGRGGSWDQDWDWERGASGRSHWGQGYGDQGMMGQNQSRQRIAGPGYGDQGGPGGTFYYEEIWLIPGPHSGRGPRGYQRNDKRVEEDICERLTQHGQIDAEDIQVKVKNGEVTLTGTVDSRQSKRMAEDALDSISGIKDVHNQLRVRQSEGQGRNQSDQDQLIGQTQMGDGQGGTASSRGQSRNQSRRNETAGVGSGSS